MLYIIFFVVYGLLIGSFCNVVISRLRTGEGMILERSHCPKCSKPILWYDNIPVISFAILRGKCRNCTKKISWQYPLVEILVSGVFGCVGYLFVTHTISSLLVAVLYVFVFASLVVILVYDAKYMEIPMNVMWFAIGILVIANIVTDIYHVPPLTDIWSSTSFLHGMSALTAFCFFFGLSYYSDETWMGYGDAFVAIAVGLLLGPIGTFVALLLAFCIGAVYGIVLMLLRQKTMKSEVPFGPFLITGLFLAFLITYMYPEYVSALL